MCRRAKSWLLAASGLYWLHVLPATFAHSKWHWGKRSNNVEVFWDLDNLFPYKDISLGACSAAICSRLSQDSSVKPTVRLYANMHTFRDNLILRGGEEQRNQRVPLLVKPSDTDSEILEIFRGSLKTSGHAASFCARLPTKPTGLLLQDLKMEAGQMGYLLMYYRDAKELLLLNLHRYFGVYGANFQLKILPSSPQAVDKEMVCDIKLLLQDPQLRLHPGTICLVSDDGEQIFASSLRAAGERGWRTVLVSKNGSTRLMQGAAHQSLGWANCNARARAVSPCSDIEVFLRPRPQRRLRRTF